MFTYTLNADKGRYALATKKTEAKFVSRMRFSLVVRASDCQCTSCNGPGFDPSIRRHSGIWGAADEAVLNIVRKNKKISPKKYLKKISSYRKITKMFIIKNNQKHFRNKYFNSGKNWKIWMNQEKKLLGRIWVSISNKKCATQIFSCFPIRSHSHFF